MKVLIIQNRADFDINGIKDLKQKNFDNVIDLVKKYDNQNFDLIVLPELFSTGWYPPIYPKSFETEENSPTIIFYQASHKNFILMLLAEVLFCRLKTG